MPKLTLYCDAVDCFEVSIKANFANTPRGVSPPSPLSFLSLEHLQICFAERQMATEQSKIHLSCVSPLVYLFIPASSLCSRSEVWPC